MIYDINKYTIKLLLNLTSNNLFFKYSPMHLAFSLIEIAREKFINEKLIRRDLFFKLIIIYGINPADFKKCYEEIKAEIEEITFLEEDKKSNEMGKVNLNPIIENYFINDSKANEHLERNKKQRIFLSKFNSKKNNKIEAVNFNDKDKIIKPTEYMSINCEVSTFKNTFNFSYKKPNSLNKKNDKTIINILRNMRHDLIKFNLNESKNNINNNLNSIPFSFKREKDIKNIRKKIRFLSNKNLVNDELPKIENNTKKKNTFILRSNNLGNIQKNYKFKNYFKYLELKVTLPNDEKKEIKNNSQGINGL